MANNAVVQKKQEHQATKPEMTRGIFYTPHVDILETEDELVLYADVPGVKPENVDVRCENGELTLHARCSPRQQEMEYALCEYGVGDFYRAFTLDESIDAGKISAELKNGVLTLHLPKAEAVKPRRIAVKGQ